MEISPRTCFLGGLAVALLLGLRLTQLWQSENQVRLHSEHLFQQLEKRNAVGVVDFLAEDYHDEWDHDRASLITRLRFVLRSFDSLTVQIRDPQVEANSDIAHWKGRIHLDGRGSELVPEILERVNTLDEHFTLSWRRQSWKPWDWKLVQVSQPSLQLGKNTF